MDIKSFKLITGEEIIGKVKDGDETTVIVQKPLAVVVQPTPQGLQVAMMPFMASDPEGTITLSTDSIIVETTPTSELEKGYIERTTSVAIATSI